MIRHLDCASMRPRLSFGGRLTPQRMVAHCLLVEGERGLTLVDTGFGTTDIAERRMGAGFVALMGLVLDPARTALAQVRAAGHDPADVTRIVLTHLDLDHAGGLGDFPGAEVHVFGEELAAARARATIKERQRYAPAQWSHGPRWMEHGEAGESWLGFDGVQPIDDDLLLVPLRGHTRGHSGVAVRRPGGGWFLHAGDSYFCRDELLPQPRCPLGLSLFQRAMATDNAARLANQERLRTLHADHGPASPEQVHVVSAHDAAEFDALTGTTD